MISTQCHLAVSIRNHTRASQEVSSQGFSRFHCLHREIISHGLWNTITVFAAFDALLRDELYFGSPLILGLASLLNPRAQFGGDAPVLEPDLHRSLRHADLVGNLLSDGGCGCRVFVELDLQCNQLILCRALTFLVLLLLGQGAFTGRSARGRGGAGGV